MKSAHDLNCLIIQHAEDYELAKGGMINDGVIATKLGLQGISSVAELVIKERDLALLENINGRYHNTQLLYSIKTARSLGAPALGFHNFHTHSSIVGLIFNKIGSKKHDILFLYALYKTKYPCI